MVDLRRVMLDRWAAHRADRAAICDFLEWCLEQRQLAMRAENGSTPHADRVLDEYYEIDRAQLERERRALLEEQCRANDARQ